MIFEETYFRFLAALRLKGGQEALEVFLTELGSLYVNCSDRELDDYLSEAKERARRK